VLTSRLPESAATFVRRRLTKKQKPEKTNQTSESKSKQTMNHDNLKNGTKFLLKIENNTILKKGNLLESEKAITIWFIIT
jgi:hypothetical protein